MALRAKRAQAWLVLVLGLALAWGVFELRFEKGDVCPYYSSWRADPWGAAALHDALLATGRQVERLTAFDPDPARGLPPPQGSAVLRLGERAFGDSDEGGHDKALLHYVRQGGFLLVAYRIPSERWRGSGDERSEATASEDHSLSPSAQVQPSLSPVPTPCPCKDKGKKLAPLPPWLPGLKVQEQGSWQRWGLALSTTAKVPPRWPLRSRQALVLEDPAWAPLFMRGEAVVMAERAYGAGRILVLADAFGLSNEGLGVQNSGRAVETWLQGRDRVVFDERALGVIESPSLSRLAARIGFGPLILVLGLLALLWVWQQWQPLLAPKAPLHKLAPLSGGGQLPNLLRSQASQRELLLRLWATHADRAGLHPRRRQAAQELLEEWKRRGSKSAEARQAYQKITRLLIGKESHG